MHVENNCIIRSKNSYIKKIRISTFYFIIRYFLEILTLKIQLGRTSLDIFGYHNRVFFIKRKPY